jgi:ankyrin repeat protein
MSISQITKIFQAVVIFLLMQSCNHAIGIDGLPRKRKLPKGVVGSRHNQTKNCSSTRLTAQRAHDARVSTPSLLLGVSSHIFTTSSGEKLRFLAEDGIWRAKIEHAYLGLGNSKTIPVICEKQRDISMMVHRLAQQRPSIHKHHIHLLPTPAQSQYVFLGTVGLLGGMEASANYVCTALHEAVKQRDLVLVQMLLASGADPNSLDKDGFSPLEYATWQGYLPSITLLLEKGADPSLATIDGYTPLHLAAMSNYVEAAKLFIEKGADVNARAEINHISCTPLDLAINLADADLVQLLLEKGAKPNIAQNSLEIFHWAAENGHLDIVRLLLARKADFNIHINDQNTCKALSLAATQGHLSVARLLLAEGADPNVATENGFTPLHWAAENGQLELVNLLLANGAHCNTAAGPDGFTPLHLAVDQAEVSVARLLLASGADPKIATEDGATPLHWATDDGDLELTNLLLENGADLDITDDESWTSLHTAADQDHLDVILRLLLHKPVLHIQNNHGESFLHILAEHGSIHTLQEVMRCIDSTQHVALNQLLAVMEDCCPALTNKDTQSILASMVDYVQGLDLNLKNQKDSTVLDILQQLQWAEDADLKIAEEVMQSLKRHQKLGGWLALSRQKRAAIPSSLSKDYVIHESDLKKSRHQ